MIERNAPITAVTYDYWNTIIAETTASLTRRKALWTEVLLDGGCLLYTSDAADE